MPQYTLNHFYIVFFMTIYLYFTFIQSFTSLSIISVISNVQTLVQLVNITYSDAHTTYTCMLVCVWIKSFLWGHPCTSKRRSHDSLGCHIHLCLFAKFDFKYLSHHTSWLKQIAGKVLLSVKHVVRRMEALEGTSMFHLVKYTSVECICNYSSFKQVELSQVYSSFI